MLCTEFWSDNPYTGPSNFDNRAEAVCDLRASRDSAYCRAGTTSDTRGHSRTQRRQTGCGQVAWDRQNYAVPEVEGIWRSCRRCTIIGLLYKLLISLVLSCLLCKISDHLG